MTGYDTAAAAILAGTATPHHLWVILKTAEERTDYALKPDPWEGPGQYQRVVFADGRDVLVRTPGLRHLPEPPTR